MTIDEVNLAEFVWKDVDKFPDHVALVCGETGRSYTYRAARDKAQRFGSSLLRIGAKKVLGSFYLSEKLQY